MQRRHFLVYSLLFTAGCSTAQGLRSSRPTPATTLQFAVTDVAGLEPLKLDYEMFRSRLSDLMGQGIDFFPVDGYAAAVAPLQAGDLDVVLTGPSEYVIINARTNAKPLIGITRPNYYSLIAVREESDIQSLADLKGKKVAMKSVGSTSGHLGPTVLLIAAGLDPQTDVEIEMLGEEGSAEAVTQGTVDAWGGNFTDFRDGLAAGPVPMRVLQRGISLPHDLFMVSSQVDPAIADQLRQTLLTHQSELITALSNFETKYAGSEFIEIQDADYNIVREFYTAIGQGELFQGGH
jgi:phosphonate transport system substrate-binding protein